MSNGESSKDKQQQQQSSTQDSAAAASPSEAPATTQSPATPSHHHGGVSITTLFVLLVVSSLFSSSLGPLVQTGLRRAAEAFLGIPPGYTDGLATTTPSYPYQQQQQQQQQQPPATYIPVIASKPSVGISELPFQDEYVPLAKRAPLIAEPDYQCVHRYTIRVMHRDPMVMMVDDFLQPGEAEHMIAIAADKMERSRVFGESKHSHQRTSSSAYLSKSVDHVVRCIEERASLLTNITVKDTEPLQVVWYTEGQEFRPHFDYVNANDLKHDYWTRFGQRYTTTLVYLNEPAEGGSTIFPKLGLDLLPRKNAAVLWYNVGLNEWEDDRTLHGGSPVKGGEKYAINIWQRKMIPRVEQILRDKETEKAQQQADPNKPVGYSDQPQQEQQQEQQQQQASSEEHKAEPAKVEL